MAKTLLQRFFSALLSIWGILTLLFFLLHSMPGDASMYFMDPENPSSVAEEIRTNLGLNQPLLVQYGKWLWSAAVFDFQYSFVDQRPVMEKIAQALPRTLALGATSLFLMYSIGIAAGLWAAKHRHSWWDRWLTAISLIFYSIPVFWLAIVLILIFAYGLELLPVSGTFSPSVREFGFWERLADGLQHLILPALTLGLSSAALVSRYLRHSVIQAMNEEFVLAARAKGLSERTVFFRHAFRASLLPLITLGGLSLPFLIGGSVLVEKIFSWHGMGWLMMESISRRDYPVILAISFFFSLFVIFGNLAADLCYYAADPRIGRMRK